MRREGTIGKADIPITLGNIIIHVQEYMLSPILNNAIVLLKII